MKYMFLIYVDDALSRRQEPTTIDEHLAFAKEAQARGAYVTCDALQPVETATTVRVRNGETLTTDGPFAETKEVLAGFYILDCKDVEEAVAFAAKIPPARDGSIEVRPIATIAGWDEAMASASAAKA